MMPNTICYTHINSSWKVKTHIDKIRQQAIWLQEALHYILHYILIEIRVYTVANTSLCVWIHSSREVKQSLSWEISRCWSAPTLTKKQNKIKQQN